MEVDDYVVLVADPALQMCVVRVDGTDSQGRQVLTVRDATGEFHPDATFRITSDKVRQVEP